MLHPSGSGNSSASQSKFIVYASQMDYGLLRSTPEIYRSKSELTYEVHMRNNSFLLLLKNAVMLT